MLERQWSLEMEQRGMIKLQLSRSKQVLLLILEGLTDLRLQRREDLWQIQVFLVQVWEPLMQWAAEKIKSALTSTFQQKVRTINKHLRRQKVRSEPAISLPTAVITESFQNRPLPSSTQRTLPI